jgi:hypothetical protein
MDTYNSNVNENEVKFDPTKTFGDVEEKPSNSTFDSSLIASYNDLKAF